MCHLPASKSLDGLHVMKQRLRCEDLSRFLKTMGAQGDFAGGFVA